MKEYSYWLDTIPGKNDQAAPSHLDRSVDAPAARALDAQRLVDVAIVGGGYTGLSAARQLAASGASVLLLEREHIGWGASSRNAGQVLTGLKIDPVTLVARYGEARARRLFEVGAEAMRRLEALIARESIECEYERAGHLQAACKPKHFDAFHEEKALLARAFGHRVELVSRAEQRTELGSDAYHGLLVDERSAALNPARYVFGLAAAARRAGACIATGAAVTSIRPRPTGRADGWLLTINARSLDLRRRKRAGELHPTDEVIARNVLVATNGYTDDVAPALRRRLVPIGSYIVTTEPLAAGQAAEILPRGRVAFDSKHFLNYFRITSDRRLLFGGRVELSRPDPASTRRAAVILRRALIRIFPGLASVRIDYAWGGNVAFTLDRMPHAGQLGGVYYAGGYCGHGIAMATYLGELIARRLAGEPIDNPLFEAPARTIPLYPLYRRMPWLLSLVGAYYKLLDWCC